MLGSIFKAAEKVGTSLANINIGGFDFFGWLLGIFEGNKKQYVYQIKPFKDNDFGTAHWLGFLSNFASLNEKITFYTFGNSKDIKFYAKVGENMQKYFENTFFATFPTSDLLLKDTKDLQGNFTLSYLYFDKATLLTDQEFKKDGFYLDPLKDVISLYIDVPPKDNVFISYYYDFNTKESFWKKLFKLIFKYKDTIKEIETKDNSGMQGMNVKFSIGFGIDSQDPYTKNGLKKNILNAFSKFKKEGKIIERSSPKMNIANFNNIVNFFHLPTKENFYKNFEYLTYRKLPYPPNLPTRESTIKNDITLLGVTDYKNDEIRFGIKNEDKFRHIYIIGKTGMGKSTLMSNMARSDMITNKGLALLDPHGDLVETLLEHVPSWRTNDVILFDVSDTNFPIGFNIMQYSTQEEKNLVVSGIVGTFKKLYGVTSWGPRLEYILRNVMLSVIEYPNANLMHIIRMITDKNFKEEVLTYVKDPIVLKFWRSEYDKRTDKFRDEAVSPITNKVGQFLSSPIVRNIFGQSTTKLNFRKIMDEGKILLVNLSKGKIGEDNAEMIGSFIVTKFQIDAMSRADIPMDKRRDFYLYIDEFQNFATESFENILSEARKYKLSLIVANQYVSQIDEKIRNAIFGNVGSIFSFALGHDDAVMMSSQYKEIITPNDLLSLPKFRAYTKLMIDGVTSDPFCMSTFPLPTPENSQEIKEKIRKQSRQRYAMEKDRLEALIKNWSEQKFNPVEKAMELAKQQLGTQDSKPTPTKSPNSIKAPQDKKPQLDNIKQTQSDNKFDSLIKSEKKFDNIKPIETIEQSPIKGVEGIQQNPADNAQQSDSISAPNNTVLGQWYDGVVKLKYNYGLFVIANGVEGLLHKNFISVPAEVRWKDMYNIGDIIKVKAMEFKEVDGQIRVVRTQI